MHSLTALELELLLNIIYVYDMFKHGLSAYTIMNSIKWRKSKVFKIRLITQTNDEERNNCVNEYIN